MSQDLIVYSNNEASWDALADLLFVRGQIFFQWTPRADHLDKIIRPVMMATHLYSATAHQRSPALFYGIESLRWATRVDQIDHGDREVLRLIRSVYRRYLDLGKGMDVTNIARVARKVVAQDRSPDPDLELTIPE